MTLKALTPLLDPVMGHNRKTLCNVKRWGRRVSEKVNGPNRSISLTSILSTQKPNSIFDPKQSQGVESHLNIDHWSAHRNTWACKFSVKSFRRPFPMLLMRCGCQTVQRGRFSARTFHRMEISAPRRFNAWISQRMEVSARLTYCRLSGL